VNIERWILSILVLALATIGSDAKAPSKLAANDALSVYRIKDPQAETLAMVASAFEIVRRDGHNYEIVVPQVKSTQFLRLMPKAELLDFDISASIQEKLQQFALESEVGYHDFTQVQAWLAATEAKFPQIAKVIRYGDSEQQRPLLALRLSSIIAPVIAPVIAPEPRAALMFTAATHGDELITVEVLMELVNQFVSSYGKDPRFTNMLRDFDLYFVPVVNPDGFVRAARYDNGRDPNRSYPYPGDEKKKPTASIAAIIDFFNSQQIIGSIDFHASGELVMYPWAYTRNSVDAAAAERFRKLTSEMAATNGYTAGPIARVIYVAPGSSADFYFWQKQAISLGIEIGDSKVPSPDQFPAFVKSQSESTWRFIESFSRTLR
jgi:hypothetical protein